MLNCPLLGTLKRCLSVQQSENLNGGLDFYCRTGTTNCVQGLTLVGVTLFWGTIPRSGQGHVNVISRSNQPKITFAAGFYRFLQVFRGTLLTEQWQTRLQVAGYQQRTTDENSLSKYRVI